MKIVTRSGVSAPTPLFAVGVSCAIMALALPMKLRGASSALSLGVVLRYVALAKLKQRLSPHL